jgi:hypothetical protein
MTYVAGLLMLGSGLLGLVVYFLGDSFGLSADIFSFLLAGIILLVLGILTLLLDVFTTWADSVKRMQR